MDVSIIIVNWNTKQLLLDCLASVYATIHELAFEVLVVDNASTDGSVSAVTAYYPEVIVIKNSENLGFAKANNQALRIMKGNFALLLNTDALLTEGAVGRLWRFMNATPDVGLSSGQLLNADGSKQNTIANFPALLPLLFNETVLRLLFPDRFPSKHKVYAVPIEVESCVGACLMVRKQAITQVGLFDERYFFFMEETDLAFGMRKLGWRSYLIPDVNVYHLQGQSAGHLLQSRIMFYRSRYQYIKKWHHKILPVWICILIFRLIVNLLLNISATIGSLGMISGCRRRVVLYGRLIGWHLSGCP
ncbi:MAG: glycosyltransferase family 2 protein [Desulfobacteraceae bacterium]|nr:glycosyltransferase family 2 protein [Desulfobacteraceae bacterium]